MPILGTYASSVQKSFNSFESISTITVGSGGASSITFSSIPSTYQHLQISGIGKASPTVNDFSNVIYNLNSDTGNNYTLHSVRGTGSSISAYSLANGPSLYSNPAIPSSYSAFANMFGTVVVDFLDYANTNKYKTVRSLHGFDTNGGYGYSAISSGVWMNTNAITSITLTVDTGSFSQYSSFALYGIKG